MFKYDNNIEDVVRAAAAALYKVRSLGSIEPLTKAPNLRASPKQLKLLSINLKGDAL